MVGHGAHGGHGEKTLRDCSDSLAEQVLNAAIEVHRELGPGLLESVYEQALAFELTERGMNVERQLEVDAFYKGQNLGLGFRADLIVEKCLLLELKAVDNLAPVHLAQMLTYLRLLGIKRGYLLNFNAKLLKEGIKRVSI